MRRPNGFTLMEMILVVVIIGLLAGLVLPRLVGKAKQARETAARAQIRSLGVALDDFERVCGRYPTTVEGLRALIEQPANLSESTRWERFLKEGVIPKDPWGRDYVYRSPGTINPDYDLFSLGPDGQEGTDDDVWSVRR